MLIDYHLGQTSVVFRVKIRNSSVSTGAGLTGLTNSSTGLIISTIADIEASATVYTVAASHVQTIATLGTFAAPSASNCRFAQVDATNHPGIYEVQLDNSRFAVSNAKSLLVSITGATNAADCDVVIPLRTVDPYSAAFGLTLAKTTNITGFNDIAATAIVSAGAITTSSGAVSSVTTTGSVTGSVGSVLTAPFKVNTAAAFSVYLVSSTDNKTPYTSPTSLAATVSKNGGAAGAIAGTIAQVGSTNQYLLSGAAADFNSTNLAFAITASGANSVYVNINTTP